MVDGSVVVDELPGASPPPGAAQIAVFITFSVILTLWTRAELAHRAIAAERAASERGASQSPSSSDDKKTGGDGAGAMPGSDSALSLGDVELGPVDKKDEDATAGDGDAESGAKAARASRGGDTAPVKPIVRVDEQLAKLAPVRCLLGDRRALIASRDTLRAWTELGCVLALFWIADRSGAVPDAEKHYDRDLFWAIFGALGAYGWFTTAKECRSNAPLNREQTEEWKGWMQVLFLLYHYFKASEIYNAIRVFIAAYVWMTGFGNFSYYYVRKDFSFHRFAQMMWRLNFFVFFVCLAMRNDYVLYYICPMHTLFTWAVYFALYVGREHNTSTNVVLGKFAICFAACYVLWEIPGVFTAVFGPFQGLFEYVDPKKPDVDPMHEWFFRSGLDRYVWIHGMACAFFHPRFESAMKKVDEMDQRRRVTTQCAIGAATLGAMYWWYSSVYVLPKLEYNALHPYTSWIPITGFIILRNLTRGLRSWHVSLFCWCGKITLETYISQFHIWLSTSNVPNAQPSALMALVPGHPMLNFALCTALYVGVSKRVFAVTNDLKIACVPDDARQIGLNAAFAAAWGVGACALGAVLSSAF